MEETGGLRENHRPVASHWQTLSHNVVHLTLIEIRTHNISDDVMGTDCIGSFKSNYHTITATTDPLGDIHLLTAKRYVLCIILIHFVTVVWSVDIVKRSNLASHFARLTLNWTRTFSWCTTTRTNANTFLSKTIVKQCIKQLPVKMYTAIRSHFSEQIILRVLLLWYHDILRWNSRPRHGTKLAWLTGNWVKVIVFNATFNNIWVISWRSG